MIDYTDIDRNYTFDKIAGTLQLVSVQLIKGTNTYVWATGTSGFNSREENLSEYRYRKLMEQE